jgi:mannose-6-phosphate isomerase-like protein (cupin superfamily)
MVELQRTEFQTVYAVRLMGKEAPHRHPDNDLTVLVQKGDLSCTLSQSTLDLQAGDSVTIPRDTTYFLVSASTSSATQAIYVFSPPLVSRDQAGANGTTAGKAKGKRRPAR